MAQIDIKEGFFQECEDLLEALNDGLSSLDTGSTDVETINAVFRAVHSIKGGAGAFGLTRLVSFSHRFENALDAVRSGKLAPQPDAVPVFFRANDILSDLVEAAREEREIEDDIEQDVLDDLIALLGGDSVEAEAPLPVFQAMTIDIPDIDTGLLATDDLPALQSPPFLYRIELQVQRELFEAGHEPLLLFRELSGLGHLSVVAETNTVPILEKLDSGQPALSWLLTLETTAPREQVEDVFEFVEGLCKLSIVQEVQKAEQDMSPFSLPGLPDLIQISDAAAAASQKENLSSAQVLERPEVTQQGQLADDGNGPRPTIRVDLERVDRLINLVGELVINQAMLSQSISKLENQNEPEVQESLDDLKQLSNEIQEGVMAIRAQPIKSLFMRMARIVREAAISSGKSARLVTIGEATEVDKTVLERLADPLTHMIRNAVDHGLETPETRGLSGKPAEGVVTLSASHRSGRVLIELKDDGAGINRQRVRQVAIEKGLIAVDADLSDAEIDNLLFLPGFSTAKEVSALSGRGVGMDVARSQILALGGRVSITSAPGKGTTFSISLPLTLAVLEGMVIDVSGETMVVPITPIVETVRALPKDIHTMSCGTKVISLRGQFIPVTDLGSLFGYRKTPPDLTGLPLLLIETDEHRKCALVADRIYGQNQVVIKGLESNYQRVPGIAAATILGDGRIALIIDAEEIAQRRFQTPQIDSVALTAIGQ